MKVSSQSATTSGTLGKMGEARTQNSEREKKAKKIRQRIEESPDPIWKRCCGTQKKAGGETSCPLKNVRIIKEGTGMYST